MLHPSSAGFARDLSVYDDLAGWANATPIGAAATYPALIWLGAPEFVRDAQLSADGRKIRIGDGERALTLVPKLPLNGSCRQPADRKAAQLNSISRSTTMPLGVTSGRSA